MAYCRRTLMAWAALGLGMALGCMSGMSDPAKLPASRDTPFVLNVPEVDKSAAVARSQRPDVPPATDIQPIAVSAPTVKSNAATEVAASLTGFQKPPPAGIQQASAVRAKAWVNGKPIFEDEVLYAFGPMIRGIQQTTPPAQLDAELRKAQEKALEALIESELLVQDAFRFLDKMPKNLEIIKAGAAKDADKRILELMRGNKVHTIDEFKQLVLAQGVTLEGLRRVLEREYVSNGWLREKIKHLIEKVNPEDIRQYYEQRSNEFMQVDKVKWQNIFISIGTKNNPTKAHARQKAEQVLHRWATGEDIAKLLEFDDGLAAANQGAGVGEIKGDIRPRELEPYLFALKEGEFGPLVELSTGFHIFRVTKREYAGVLPYTEAIQLSIRNKLVNEIVERERASYVRTLRDKASIEIDRD